MQSLMIGGPNSDEVTVYGASRTLLPTWFLVGQVFALKAHTVERRHGKAEAVGSNPTGGSGRVVGYTVMVRLTRGDTVRTVGPSSAGRIASDWSRTHADVAQSGSATPCQGVGRGFESRLPLMT